MSNLRKQLIRLGNKNPELRKHLRPILSRIKQAGAWGYNPDENDDFHDLVIRMERSESSSEYVDHIVDTMSHGYLGAYAAMGMWEAMKVSKNREAKKIADQMEGAITRSAINLLTPAFLDTWQDPEEVKKIVEQYASGNISGKVSFDFDKKLVH